MRIGYFLSCEEYTPKEIVEQARLAEEAGFESLWISDHFHPWNDEQGQSPLVWSMIGAISQVCDLPVTTAVTCPTTRIHPVVIAQAAATSSVLLDGRFTLGIGTGEALNEHVLGDRWPHTDLRLEQLEEAVQIIRALWTGEVVSHEGRHYSVDTARLYTLPEEPPQIFMSAFGPKALEVAVRIADGFITTQPDGESLQQFRSAKGGNAPGQVGFKVAWAPTRDEAVGHAHRLWASSGLPGELAQVLPSPRHFEQASQLVTPEMTAGSAPCGPDTQMHVDAFAPYVEAGFDEIYVANMGPHHAEMIRVFGSEVLPEVRSRHRS